MKPFVMKTLVICCWVFAVISPGPAQAQQQNPTPSTDAVNDSLLLDFSVEELLKIRTSYQAETERLLSEKDLLRGEAIEEIRYMLGFDWEIPGLDRVLLQLAELEYEEAVRIYGKAMDEYSEALTRFEAGELSEEPAEPAVDYERALKLYQRILNEFSQGEFAAAAHYNKAFLLEDSGQGKSAFRSFLAFLQNHPRSRFVPDALMRVAEYYFAPPRWEIEKAITYYERVLDHRDTPQYDAALYRLGWCYYKLSDYPAAISYFTVLADDVQRMKKLDPEVKYHLPVVRDEAVEYIGIGFLDFGGAEDAARYFDEIGGRGYGMMVFKKIADALMDSKEEYLDAIQAYEFLLAMYPETPQGPYIQTRIASAYEKLEDKRMARLTLADLSRRFGTDSGWWQRLAPNERKLAGRSIEKSTRESINALLKEAEEQQDMQLYDQAISDSRSYLKSFPTDSHAVQVHWNMALALDSKVNRPEEAFTEYLSISGSYSGSEYQKQAAANAIALADMWVRRDSLGLATSAAGTEGEVIGLTESEERLILAANNFLKNFPDEEESAKILVRAGDLYYKKKDFKSAIQYFKTLAKHFPESQEMDYARYLIMESYFGKGDYESTELVAGRIKNIDSEYAAKAGARVAESVFLQAETLSGSESHEQAAHEYLRLLDVAPDAEFADLALYNAGVEFEKSSDFNNAIAAYEKLISDFPQSQHFINSMNNLAFDYREIEDYANAGRTYEKLVTHATGDSMAQTALFNASVSYVQAEKWSRAISINNAYAERFPRAPDAADLLFDNARYHLKLDEVDSANAIYAQFSAKYPDSPKVIEAHYRRGQYYQEGDNAAAARAEFHTVLQKYETFQSRKLETDDFIVAEAQFELTRFKFDEFAAIELTLPESNLEAAKSRKKELLVQLTEDYTKVAGFGTHRLYEATFKMGQVYEIFARAWAEQELAATDETQRIVAKKDINRGAADLYQQAVQAYKDGATALQEFSIKRSQETPAHVEGELDKLSLEDSTLAAGKAWIVKCQGKVSESLYLMAELNTESLQLLRESPLPEGLSSLEQLIYRKEILHKAVAPLAQEIVAAHTHNIQESAQLGLENEWVDFSRKNVLKIGNIVPIETERLGTKALKSYSDMLVSYEQLIATDDEQAVDVAEQMTALLEFSSTSAQASARIFEQIWPALQTQAANAMASVEHEELLFSELYAYSVLADSLAEQAYQKRKHYEARFAEAEQINFEDAFFTFDDLHFTLNDGSEKVLTATYQISSDPAVPNSWRRRIGLALAKRNPAEYAEEMGLAMEELVIPSGSDWVVSSDSTGGWYQTDFADEQWSNAYNEGLAANMNGSAQQIWLLDIDSGMLAAVDSSAQFTPAAAMDGAQQTALLGAVERPQTVYFRKSFELDGPAASGQLQIATDDSYTVYVNGEQVVQAVSTGAAQSHDLTGQLKLGRNTLAIKVVDADQSHGSLEAIVSVRTITDWSQQAAGTD